MKLRREYLKKLLLVSVLVLVLALSILSTEMYGWDFGDVNIKGTLTTESDAYIKGDLYFGTYKYNSIYVDTGELYFSSEVTGPVSLSTLANVAVKATGAELTTGTDDAKFATAKSIKDSHNVPSVVPSTDGNVMTSNGTNWVSEAPAGGGGGAFSTTSNVTSNTTGTLATDDFVFGSDQLADDGNTDHDIRMLFDKSKGAFRAGKAQLSEWDDANLGYYSVGFGFDTQATQSCSVAIGNGSTATGTNAVSLGEDAEATAMDAFCVGKSSLSSGNGSTVIGVSSTASGFNAVAMGSKGFAYLYGQHVKSAGSFSLDGESQSSTLILRCDTPSNIEEIMSLNNSLGYKSIIPDDTVWNFTGKINALNADAVGVMCGKIEGTIKRSNGTTSFPWACITSELGDELGVVFKVVPDDTDDYLKIYVTGVYSTILHWNCSIDMLETGF